MGKEQKDNTKIFSIDSKKVKMKKVYCVKCNKYRKFKKPNISYTFYKTLVQFFLLFVPDVAMKRNRYFKKKNQLRY